MYIHYLYHKRMKMKLFMLLLGCKPPGRNTEQHDVFFGIAAGLKDLADGIKAFWPEANGKIHIDAWREVNFVGGYQVTIAPRDKACPAAPERLFFLNLGGYKPGEFEEYHYKMLAVAADKGAATQQAFKTAFYKHTGFEGATSHIDDKYGVDVDDLYEIGDILPASVKDAYTITLSPVKEAPEDECHLGYLKLEKLQS
jgi:hypothetical protein